VLWGVPTLRKSYEELMKEKPTKLNVGELMTLCKYDIEIAKLMLEEKIIDKSTYTLLYTTMAMTGLEIIKKRDKTTIDLEGIKEIKKLRMLSNGDALLKTAFDLLKKRGEEIGFSL